MPAALAARESERLHLARELHDDLGQHLLAIRIELSRLTQDEPGDPSAWRARACTLLPLVDEAMASVRRVASDLRPPALTDSGLLAALRALAQEWSGRSAMKVEIDTRLPDSRHNLLRAEVCLNSFRIVQEALTNAARHAGASMARVEIFTEFSQLVLRVSDNGRGLQPGAVLTREGLGLRGMSERAEACGGRLRIDGSPGRGCIVEARLPLAPRLSADRAASRLQSAARGVN